MALALAPFHPAAAASPVRVETPWARASLGGVKNAIVYCTIANDGPDPVRIVGGLTPVAAHVEFHIHVMEGSVMTMRRLEAIEVKAGEKTVLQPGGLHIMLVDLRQPLKEGETIPVTLTLDNGAWLAMEVKVLGATAMRPPP